MKFEWGKRTYVMGIVNVTPDSFSGDGLIPRGPLGVSMGSPWIENAIAKGVQMEADGADILDVGGESTRPRSSPISVDEELSRVLPVIKGLASKVKIPLSIDTYKGEVAHAAIQAGASMVNDVWAGQRSRTMLTTVARMGVPVVLMHNRSHPNDAAESEKLGGRYVGVEYGDLIEDIKKDLLERIDAALAAGVAKENIIIDPGIGFGKTVEQNLELVRRFDEMKSLGYPILAGPSRKSFVGYTLDLSPENRLEGTLAAVTLCIQKGADIVRVHDVRECKRAAALADAVVRR